MQIEQTEVMIPTSHGQMPSFLSIDMTFPRFRLLSFAIQLGCLLALTALALF